MSELSIAEYIEIIAKLKISDYIYYYFAVYFFIGLLQRSLGVELHVYDELKANPKILISFILIYIFYTLNTIVAKIFFFSSIYEILLTSSIILVFIAYIFEKQILSPKGLIKYIFKYKITTVAKNGIIEQYKQYDQISKDKEFLKNHPKKVRRRPDSVVNTQQARKEAEDYSKNYKILTIHLLMDLFICALLLYKIYCINIYIFILMAGFSVIFIMPRINQLLVPIKTDLEKIEQSTPAIKSRND